MLVRPRQALAAGAGAVVVGVEVVVAVVVVVVVVVVMAMTGVVVMAGMVAVVVAVGRARRRRRSECGSEPVGLPLSRPPREVSRGRRAGSSRAGRATTLLLLPPLLLPVPLPAVLAPDDAEGGRPRKVRVRA